MSTETKKSTVSLADKARAIKIKLDADAIKSLTVKGKQRSFEISNNNVRMHSSEIFNDPLKFIKKFDEATIRQFIPKISNELIDYVKGLRNRELIKLKNNG